MALNIEALRTELQAVEVRIIELHAIEKAEGAARAFPELSEAMHRRMTLRGHIEQLEREAADAAHAAHVAEGVAVLQAAYDADPANHAAADAILAHVATDAAVVAAVPRA